MWSVMSVVSVNLIASLAMPRVDSTRARGADGRAANVVAKVSASDDTPRTDRVLATASRYLGVRYRMGGTKPSAFDCSGFVRYVFARHGVTLPRTAREQATAGNPILVGPDSLEVGDLLFFETRRGRASHVAIYAGSGRIIHASAGSKRVRYDDLASPRGRWFIQHLSYARRVLASNPRQAEGTATADDAVRSDR